MTIEILKGDITKISCDAIINPANSYGYMGGGVAGVIKRVGGIEIEQEAVTKSPIPVGTAIATTSGSLPCKYVIHSPTMKNPAMRIDVSNVEKATRAALDLSKKMNLKTITFPGMGTGVGGVSVKDAAQVMVKIAKEYSDKFEKIIFIAYNNDLYNAFNENI